MAGRAQELRAEADKKSKGGGGLFARLFSGPSYDEASELYVQAANQFKLAKDWNAAAECLTEAAFCAQKLGSKSDEANNLVEAGNCMKRVSTAEAVKKWEQAVDIFNSDGAFGRSAKLLKSSAELLEENLSDEASRKACAQMYAKAADFFEMDEYGKSNLSACNIKVAEFKARDGELYEAAQIYEKEGEKALGNTLLQYGAKDHFLKAGILHLAMGDSVTVEVSVDRYRSMDPKFAGSREGKLLDDLAKAFKANDVDQFIEKLGEYDDVTPLDAWKTEMLVKAKKHLSGGGGADPFADIGGAGSPTNAEDIDLT
jgi:alpha-soluble NSF attachment protein